MIDASRLSHPLRFPAKRAGCPAVSSSVHPRGWTVKRLEKPQDLSDRKASTLSTPQTLLSRNVRARTTDSCGQRVDSVDGGVSPPVPRGCRRSTAGIGVHPGGWTLLDTTGHGGAGPW